MASLRHLNTLGVDCEADALFEAATVDQLKNAWQTAGTAPLLVGGGSNLVLPPRYRGPVCRLVMSGIAHEHDRSGAVLLTVAAGQNWHGVVRYALGRGWPGLENLALIPGSVGAAPLQNIGAYGVELDRRLERVTVFDPAADRCMTLTPSECAFGYRTSRFREAPGLVVTELTLRLEPGAPVVANYPDVVLELERLGVRHPSSRAIAEAVIRIRRRKLPDPRHHGNVGSFFKNPIVEADVAAELTAREGLVAHPAAAGQTKLSAAQLIDRCGWKGRREGRVGVWPRQPLVLVNLGGASGPDFLHTADLIGSSVRDRFGVTLEIEPTVVASPR
jgi:UDP-N-acetylmuramate dehydrogenase